MEVVPDHYIDGEEEPIDPELEWELKEGIPQVEDDFIQQWMDRRRALIAEEKKQRHDHVFKQTMSPLARQAAKIMMRIRKRELKAPQSMAQPGCDGVHAEFYDGMMYPRVRSRMTSTMTWKILQQMPKGALLHCHMDGAIDIPWLINECIAEPGLYVISAAPIADAEMRQTASLDFRYKDSSKISADGETMWSANYKPGTPVPVHRAARNLSRRR